MDEGSNVSKGDNLDLWGENQDLIMNKNLYIYIYIMLYIFKPLEMLSLTLRCTHWYNDVYIVHWCSLGQVALGTRKPTTRTKTS